MSRCFLLAGALYGFAGVLLGAFAAHALRGLLSPAMLGAWDTAVRYQFWHALALLIVGMLLRQAQNCWLTAAGWAFVLGVLLFCGSLYLLAWSGIGWLGAITPFGGLSLLAGWIFLLAAVARARSLLD
ncbi:MAG: DUF423 domain-containing protein [Salinisphaera sp.]|nr:DUF423 domain-containing protein [Salinisphaera sp.]